MLKDAGSCFNGCDITLCASKRESSVEIARGSWWCGILCVPRAVETFGCVVGKDSSVAQTCSPNETILSPSVP